MKKNRLLKLIIGVLFISYVASYIISESGYYEYKLGTRVALTNKEIEKFEEDVKAGESVDINDYTIPEVTNYSNKFNNTLYSASNKINQGFKLAIKNIFKVCSKLVNET